MYINVLIYRNHDYRIVEQFLRYIHNFKTPILFFVDQQKGNCVLIIYLISLFSNFTGIGKAYFDKPLSQIKCYIFDLKVPLIKKRYQEKTSRPDFLLNIF